MPVTPAYRAETLSVLNLVAHVTDRSMFGGVGLYREGLFFAVMANDRLYFKVDSSNRGDFEAEGMGPFMPFDNPDQVMQYYEVPAFVLDNPDELAVWMDKAVRVAELKKAKSPTPKRRRPPRAGR
ncbi:MAG TPA: TfoX/Sxy family protein [Armatimonadota bacterium]